MSSEAVLAGIRVGRSWIAGSAAVELSLTASAGGRSAGIGQPLETRGDPVVVRADVHGVPSGTVSFHTVAGMVRREPLTATGAGVIQWRTTAAESLFVRVEVRHPGGHMAALTNPIILAGP